MDEELRMVTMQAVKEACHKICMTKWQSMWENSSTGRRFYEFYPSVTDKRRHDFPNISTTSYYNCKMGTPNSTNTETSRGRMCHLSVSVVYSKHHTTSCRSLNSLKSTGHCYLPPFVSRGINESHLLNTCYQY